jgi:hypothetical protein
VIEFKYDYFHLKQTGLSEKVGDAVSKTAYIGERAYIFKMTGTYREVGDSRFQLELYAYSGELCRELPSEKRGLDSDQFRCCSVERLWLRGSVAGGGNPHLSTSIGVTTCTTATLLTSCTMQVCLTAAEVVTRKKTPGVYSRASGAKD